MKDDSRMRTAVELIGLATLIVSVLFLALQVRQGNEVARATVAYELSNMFNDYHGLVMGDPEVAELLVRMARDESEFTEVERRQIQSLANRLFNIWTSAHQGFENGVVTPEEYDNYQLDVSRAMGLKAAVPFWRSFLDTYPSRKAWPIFAPLLEGA